MLWYSIKEAELVPAASLQPVEIDFVLDGSLFYEVTWKETHLIQVAKPSQ